MSLLQDLSEPLMNGTTLRLALRSLPEVPSRTEPRMATTVTAHQCPHNGPFPCQCPSPLPFCCFLESPLRKHIFLRESPHTVLFQNSEPHTPSYLDLIVSLLFPSLVGEHQKNQKAPFRLAWGESLTTVPSPSQSSL